MTAEQIDLGVTWAVRLALPIMGVALVWALYRAARTLTAQPMARLPFTWGYTVRKIGTAPMVGLAVAVAVLYWWGRGQANAAPDALFAPARMIEALLPLLAAGHAAFLFAPDDEPALEVVLALPRPLTWLVAERLGLLLVGYGLPALLVSLLAGGQGGADWLRWLPPLLVLSGLAVMVTVVTRQAALSMGVIGLLWFGLIYAGDGLVQQYPYLWLAHIYLQPEAAHYALNRAGLLLGGAGLLVLAATYLLRDTERVLLGGRTLPHRRGVNV